MMISIVWFARVDGYLQERHSMQVNEIQTYSHKLRTSLDRFEQEEYKGWKRIIAEELSEASSSEDQQFY
jgi:hypothetical protein